MTNLTHLDGRNSQKLLVLKDYFSEFAWMKYRLDIMAKWLKWLDCLKILKVNKSNLSGIIDKFDEKDAEEIREIEKTTNHDLKAIEYYLRDKLKTVGEENAAGLINLGLGSEDINNIALRLIVSDSWQKVFLPEIVKLSRKLLDTTDHHKALTMLARTHGKPASVTTFGKEIGLYMIRVINETERINALQFSGKLAGEVGNYNALQFILPKVDWLDVSEKFISSFGLVPNLFATQINPYDDLIIFFDAVKRLNNILAGFSKDIWLYSLLDYVKIVKKEEEVGSAGMPHKVNPIYFEGAEGGLEQASGELEFYSRKLSYSRLQRDFSDSTVRRNLASILGLCLLSYQSLNEGCRRLDVNTDKIKEDLDKHYEVVSEGLQNYIRLKGEVEGYEKIKKELRGVTLNKVEFNKLISKIGLSEKIKMISLDDYQGLSVKITELILKEAKKKLDEILPRYSVR